jgi:hypothetical protein
MKPFSEVLVNLKCCEGKKILFSRIKQQSTKNQATIYCACQKFLGTCLYSTACKLVRKAPELFAFGNINQFKQERLDI